ncbi:MAG TPA: four helix bundle protein [Vicinamibacterales bacterium]
MPIRNYRDLLAWQSAMDPTVAVYETTGNWPRPEEYGLTRQVRQAAVSVPCNIAEGQGRRSDPEFRHFLSIAHGSLREVETCVLLGERLKYLGARDAARLLDHCAEVGRLINGLASSLRGRR